ncbi:MAG: hypothetical protein OEX22_04850, partial [Cyclobacteriaceae bacterium]|nr:hypothetical protein [Cyclobacteriaceae bacterium]
MFSKSIIYLLFPTIFSSISVETDFEKEREIKTEKVSTQQFVENGIEKVTVALKAISIEEITTFITNLD